MHFNSRPHGGRQGIFPQTQRSFHFNSRPHGGRLPRDRLALTSTYFNSRPHGGRPCEITFHCSHGISTHALTEGDGQPQEYNGRKIVFQLTPSRRATKLSSAERITGIFQLTPSRRATSSTFGCPLQAIFQLTPSRRATANLDKFFF